MRGIKCKTCGTENSRKSSFCSQCGTALSAEADTGGKCPACGQAVGSKDRFCPNCRHRLAGDHEPVMNEGRWYRTEGDFATALETRDLQTALQGGLIVEQGTHALLFHNGKYIDLLAPGRHRLSSVGDRLASMISKNTGFKVVLVDAGVAALKFTVDGLKTSDPLFVRLECELMVRVEDPDTFYLNLFKQRRSLGLKELSAWLEDELRDAVNEEIKKHSVEDLSSDRTVKDRLAEAIRTHLGKSLALYGLGVVQCRTLSVSHPKYNELEAKSEDQVIAVWEKQSDLAGRKQLFEATTEEERQDIYEATKKAEIQEQKAEVYPRIRRAIMSGKMDEIRSEQEFEAFLDEIDKEKLLRKEEKDELLRTFEEKKEDHDLARQHLLAKLDIEYKVERRRLELLSEQDLEKDVLEARLKTDRVRFEHELSVEQEKNAARREQEQKDHVTRLEKQLSEARNEQEIEALKLETRQKKWELGQTILERQRAAKIKQQREEMLLDAERRERELALKIQEMKAFSDSTPEAVIASADTEKAKILADLKKTEMLGGWSEDQILAAAAENSPEVARAFQEKYKGLATEEIKELYERMLKDKDENQEKYREEQKQARTDMKDITMESVRGQKPVSQVVYPPHGGPAGGGQSSRICPHCGDPVRPGSNFCGNCGATLQQ